MSAALRLAAGFDETAYLKARPGVAQAVDKGTFSSGWHQYVRNGFRATDIRPGVEPELMRSVRRIAQAGAQEPMPAEHLRARVHGDKHPAGFKEVGRVVAFDILRALAGAGAELPPGSRILDFGCGCGRVLRFLHHMFPDSEFVGTDIDAEAIAWNKNRLSHLGSFLVNGAWPPLAVADQSIDFVYASSVFTHLPEDMQFAWLKELRRVTKKGGHLLLTVHGPQIFQKAWEQFRIVEDQRRAADSRGIGALRRLADSLNLLPDPPFGTVYTRRRFEKNGFAYLLEGEDTPGLPGFYRTAFHSEAYLRRRWSRYFDILRIVGRGIANSQDLVLCRRPS